METVVIAVGGNALLRQGDQGTAEEQFKRARETAESILDIFKQYDIVITHGNGPQVGAILLQNEHSKNIVPPMPLDVCDAMSQGSIGYMLEQSFNEIIKKHHINKDIVTIMTRVLVDSKDPAFEKPSKPIGPFYSKDEAMALKEKNHWNMVEDAGRGWRRVVPSPKPIEIIEKKVIRSIIDSGFIAIAVGGGGIPVVRKNGGLEGVEAVIDKDLGAAALGKDINADMLFVLTSVDQVYINYNKENQKALSEIHLPELSKYIEEGHFKPGSMLPKILASVEFIKTGGKAVLITSPEKLNDALAHKNGTWIYP